MAYSGIILNFIGYDSSSESWKWYALPSKYIFYDTFKITPAQMVDLDSTVSDTTGVLHRTVLSHTRTKIEFELVPMTDECFQENILPIIQNSYAYFNQTKFSSTGDLGTRSHKTRVRYYNPYEGTTSIGTFYVADIDFKVRSLNTTKHIMYYDSIRIALIEY